MAAVTTVRSLTELALKELGADVPTTAVVMRVAVRLAAAVNSWPGLRGSEKQGIVVGVLRDVLTSDTVRSRMAAADHEILVATLDTVVPETLALVVAAGRGEIDLRRPTVGCVGRIASLLCRVTAVAVPLSEAERGALQSAAEIVGSIAPSNPETPPPELEVSVPEQTPEQAIDATVADQTATENKSESVTPATPIETLRTM